MENGQCRNFPYCEKLHGEDKFDLGPKQISDVKNLIWQGQISTKGVKRTVVA